MSTIKIFSVLSELTVNIDLLFLLIQVVCNEVGIGPLVKCVLYDLCMCECAMGALGNVNTLASFVNSISNAHHVNLLSIRRHIY